MSDNLYSLMSTTVAMSCEMRDEVRLVYDDPRLICVKCGRLLINPWQNECGHRICRTCLDDLLALSSGIISCPSGDEDCVPINAKQVCFFVILVSFCVKEVVNYLLCWYKLLLLGRLLSFIEFISVFILANYDKFHFLMITHLN